MGILSLLNSTPMYAICGGIIAFVAAVCIVFMVRAYRAGIAMGMDPVKLKRAITSSATFSVLPSVGILLGVIALSGSLGTPWPWLRLSVIGALHYETQVAQAAAEAVGIGGLSAADMTAQAFSTIALLMSVCIMWGMVLSVFFNKRYLGRLGSGKKTGTGGAGFGDIAMTAMFIEYSAVFTIIPANRLSTPSLVCRIAVTKPEQIPASMAAAMDKNGCPAIAAAAPTAAPSVKQPSVDRSQTLSME